MKNVEMFLTPQSSNVKAIGHSGTQLFVEFGSGSHLYIYERVDNNMFDCILNAPSIGKFMIKHITRNAAFPFSKLALNESSATYVFIYKPFPTVRPKPIVPSKFL